jgi:hypothetical protein
MSGLSELVRRLIVVTRSRTEPRHKPTVHCNGETWDSGPNTEMIDAAIAVVRDTEASEETRLPLSVTTPDNRADPAADSPEDTRQPGAVKVAPAWRPAKAIPRGMFLHSTGKRAGILSSGHDRLGEQGMSKLMRDLAEAEERRKSEENRLAAERDGEADALAWLAEEARGTAKATEIQETQRAAQEVARRRAEAEAAAIQQARARLKAETAARALTLERVALERDAERLAQQRREAEELALAEARRREQAAAELRVAIAARLKRETQAKESTDARVASEQAAVQAANERIQMERSLEAIALSRRAAEQDFAQLAEQRALREAEAIQAGVVRREAEAELHPAVDGADNFGHPTVLAELPETKTASVAAEASPPPPLPKMVAAVAGLVVGVALGWLCAEQFGATSAPQPLAQPAPKPTLAQELRLDTDAEAFGRRAESQPLAASGQATGVTQSQQ